MLHPVAEIGAFVSVKENKESEPIANRKRVRIILVWCGKQDLNSMVSFNDAIYCAIHSAKNTIYGIFVQFCTVQYSPVASCKGYFEG